jgi:hypothetical protein
MPLRRLLWRSARFNTLDVAANHGWSKRLGKHDLKWRVSHAALRTSLKMGTSVSIFDLVWYVTVEVER